MPFVERRLLRLGMITARDYWERIRNQVCEEPQTIAQIARAVDCGYYAISRGMAYARERGLVRETFRRGHRPDIRQGLYSIAHDA